MLQAVFQALELLVLRLLDHHLKDEKRDEANEEMKQSVRSTNTINEQKCKFARCYACLLATVQL